MSPFAHYLRELRSQRGLRQKELADLLGCEQSYISGLEVGVNGPPSTEFVAKLVNQLGLTSPEQEEIKEIINASQRRLILAVDSPVAVYWLLKSLREQIQSLHPAQIKIIQEFLDLKEEFRDHAIAPVRRVRQTKKMEAKM